MSLKNVVGPSGPDFPDLVITPTRTRAQKVVALTEEFCVLIAMYGANVRWARRDLENDRYAEEPEEAVLSGSRDARIEANLAIIRKYEETRAALEDELCALKGGV